MTGPQRTRLVLALGAVNLVLAVVAFGLAGTIEPPDQTGSASASPVVSVPPVAAGSPSPSVAPPSAGPTGSEPPAATSQPTPAASPVTGEEPGTGGPEPGTGSPEPTEDVVGRPPTPAPVATGAPTPTGPPPPRPTPTAAPPVVPPPVTEPATKPRPPCPGTVASAPGLVKGSGDASRPCRGGEDRRGGGSADVDLARGDERGQTRTKPWRGRSKREVA